MYHGKKQALFMQESELHGMKYGPSVSQC